MGTVFFRDGGQRFIEIGVFAIHLVDYDHARSLGLIAHFPGLFRAHVQAAHSAHGDNRAFRHGQRADHLAGEIEVARHVDQVDLGVLPLQRRERGRNRNRTPGLFGIKVRGGGSILHAALAVDRPGGEQQRLDERRLALAAVAHDSDVANVLGAIVLH